MGLLLIPGKESGNDARDIISNLGSVLFMCINRQFSNEEKSCWSELIHH